LNVLDNSNPAYNAKSSKKNLEKIIFAQTAELGLISAPRRSLPRTPMRGEDKLCQNKFIVRWGRRLQTSMPPRKTAPAHNWGQKHCQKIGKRPLFSP